MSDRPITSLPGYPHFYAISINNYIRDSHRPKPEKPSNSHLQRLPYTTEGLAQLDGLNENPRQVYPDRQRPIPTTRGQAWISHKPLKSSSLSPSCTRVSNNPRDFSTTVQEMERPEWSSCDRHADGAAGVSEPDPGGQSEEMAQQALIDSILLMLKDLQPDYLTGKRPRLSPRV
ncbi:uncharacterized protein L3040_004448 [Drepanopeziza brunnea f. sp. 'multigermtubi']|uniref:Uncharacterized protein n=1 Tax=Marssonina brunnea f. sp. multigermtubi (strain MB_m1) TaxID=1072389 RepID=K1XYJ3_MARBU|nr:uncharacterized protein MBM_03681 [Drepanopeziza brunnea f. sp. 'multigermtubi' MB_m1]EKD17909.1 hypothetical protein MBM_03681 [Drepanopeziza brunnea f. sp. 'multigermtubi' MB_m1]KAJ5043061.1 hypothetical protein L3040_004448 [Drepanopeziza brunnea f. sp. 'multigermtubi']